MPTSRLRIRGLHPHQVDVFRSPARFKVIAAGRRWGKSRVMQAMAFEKAWAGGRVWWVGPNYPLCRNAWREMTVRARKLYARINRADRRIEFPTGGFIEVRSADNPDSLRSEGLDRVIVDEAAFCAEHVWTDSLRATLTDRLGDAVLGSTPNGRNWFYRMWAGQRPDRESWRFPTVDNPYIEPSEVEDAKAELSARAFQQEYEAAFRDLAEAVFRHVRASATAQQQERGIDGHSYVLGVDWARTGDYTAVIVIDLDLMAVVYADRWTGVEYALQMSRIKAVVDRFAPVAVVSEVNNMGGPLSELLRNDGLPIVEFTSTNATKLLLVDSLSLSLERQAITLRPFEPLLQELESYESKRLPAGGIRYQAPDGQHDDLVMATMLALWGADKASIDYSATMM